MQLAQDIHQPPPPPPSLPPSSQPQPAAANKDILPIGSSTAPVDVDLQTDPLEDVNTSTAPMDVDLQPGLPFPGWRVNSEWEPVYLEM